MTCSDIFRLSKEINSRNTIRCEIVSVDLLHGITEEKACDSLARYGVVTEGRRYPIHTWRSKDPAILAVKGIVIEFEKFAVIIVANDCNVCWTRFTRVKELAHIYAGINPKEYSDVDGLLDAARTSMDIPPHNNQAISDENACFYLAMEILLPDQTWPWQKNLRKVALNMHKQKPLDYLRIAKRFRIPRDVVRHFFESDWVLRSFRGHRAV